MAQHWDLIVIGGGSGGLACAQRAAEHGARVVLAEPGAIGGTCVNVGCVPKKIMFHAADLAHGIEDAAGYGFDVALAGHDWAVLKERRDAYVRRLHGVYLENLARRNVTLLRTRARLLGAGRVAIGGETHDAARIVVATGGRPLVPDLPGASAGITSDGFFALPSMPESVAIIGSGYVAAELSGVFAALGARVTVAIRHERMLRSFDEMLSRRLMTAMRADGIGIVDHAVVSAISTDADGHRIALADGRSLGPHRCVIWAIGRTPNTADLGLAEAGVATRGRGEIATDLRQDTSAAGIHAIGDVTGRSELTPVAIAADGTNRLSELEIRLSLYDAFAPQHRAQVADAQDAPGRKRPRGGSEKADRERLREAWNGKRVGHLLAESLQNCDLDQVDADGVPHEVGHLAARDSRGDLDDGHASVRSRDELGKRDARAQAEGSDGVDGDLARAPKLLSVCRGWVDVHPADPEADSWRPQSIREREQRGLSVPDDDHSVHLDAVDELLDDRHARRRLGQRFVDVALEITRAIDPEDGALPA